MLLLCRGECERSAQDLRRYGRTHETGLYYKGFYDEYVMIGHVSIRPFEESKKSTSNDAPGDPFFLQKQAPPCSFAWI